MTSLRILGFVRCFFVGGEFFWNILLSFDVGEFFLIESIYIVFPSFVLSLIGESQYRFVELIS